MKTTRGRVIVATRWVVGVVISGVTLYLALQKVSLPEMAGAFNDADWPFIGLALLSVAANTWAKAVRWKIIVGSPGKQISLSNYCAVLLAGQTLNTIYPARLGDLARAYALGGMGAGGSYTLGTLVFEKLADTLCYSALIVLLLAVASAPTWLNQVAYGMLVFTLVFTLAVAVAYARGGWLWQVLEHILKRLPAWVHQLLIARLQAALEGVTSLRSGAAIWRLSLWSVFIWATAILNNLLVFKAMNLRLPLSASILTLVVLQAGIAFPAVPGKIGLFELACVLALSVFGVPGSTAFSYGVLLHAVVLVPSTFAGLLFLWILGLPKEVFVGSS